MPESTRAYIYRVVLAVIPVLVAFGYVQGGDVTLWTNLAAAVLGLGASGLATVNTTIK